MKKIIFKDIFLSYFLSTGERVEHKFQDGITFIRGENKSVGQKEQNNGVGKTAIFLDGLVYSLYGETTRSLKKSEIPFNRGGKKKCIVRLRFDVVEGDDKKEVEITRTINPSKFTLKVDSEDVSNSNASATQDYLVDVILGGIKKEVFQHSIAMKINSTIPFMQMKKVDRDKFVGGVFDLSYLKEADKLTRDEYNKNLKEVGEKEVRLTSSKPQLTSIEDQIVFIEKQDEARKQERIAEINKLELEIKSMVIGDRPKEINFDVEEGDINEKIRKLKLAETSLLKKIREEEQLALEVERKASEEAQKEKQRLFEEDQKRKQKEFEIQHEIKQKEAEAKKLEDARLSEISNLKQEIKKDMESMSCTKCGREFDEESKKVIEESITSKKTQLKTLLKNGQ